MKGRPETLAHAVGWTLLQAAVYFAVFEMSTAGYSAVREWRPDIGRGTLWWYAFLSFVGLALAANVALTSVRFDFPILRRLTVWFVALLPLAAFTITSASAAPLAVLLVWVCVLTSVAVREGLGLPALRRRSLTSRTRSRNCSWTCSPSSRT